MTSTSTRCFSPTRGCRPRIWWVSSMAGWRVATGSLGPRTRHAVDGLCRHVARADRRFQPVRSAAAGSLRHPGDGLPTRCGCWGRRPWPSAARGEEDVPAQSVLKLLGSEAMQRACEDALNAKGADGLVLPRGHRPVRPAEPGQPLRQLVRPVRAHLRRDHRRRHFRNPAQHHRRTSTRPAAQLARRGFGGCKPLLGVPPGVVADRDEPRHDRHRP